MRNNLGMAKIVLILFLIVSIGYTQSVRFDGSDDWLTVANEQYFDDRMDWDDEWTFCCWFYYEGGGDNAHYATFWDKYNGTNGFQITLWPAVGGEANVLVYMRSDAVNGFRDYGTTDMHTKEDQWHHLAVIYDGSKTNGSIRIWIDLVEETVNLHLAGVLTGSIANATSPRMGTDNTDLRDMEGRMDDVAIYDCQLSESQIEKHYNKGISAMSDNIIEAWDFDEISGGYHGKTNNNNDASLTGTTVRDNCPTIGGR